MKLLTNNQGFILLEVLLAFTILSSGIVILCVSLASMAKSEEIQIEKLEILQQQHESLIRGIDKMFIEEVHSD